ncbi:MAG: hypothetical protein BWK79_19335 [Beggiatoa sp. IS2]|nr:MAG: hypothetical protein BWK79_19335 [Beggiatoa sp. IS2]
MQNKLALLFKFALAVPIAVTFLWVGEATLASEDQKTPRTISYKPPMVLGRPNQRIGGGSRGGENAPSIVILAPEHTGQTIEAQPTLYWSTSHVGSKSVYFTLVYADPQKAMDHPMPLLKVAMPPKEGLQKLNLSKHNVSLEAEVVYKWSVTVSLDEKQSSKDVVASGTIQRIQNNLSKQLVAVKPSEYPFIYAEAGLWYDAFDALTTLVEMQKDDKNSQQQRVELLKQVGLDKAVNI